MNKKIEKSITLNSYDAQNKIFSGIESTAKMLPALNSSAMNLARALSSSLNGTQLTFVTITKMVTDTINKFILLL